MNEKKQNFDELKRLLKFKRHEVPPPGYFNNFSDQVISRIRAGEAGGQRSFEEILAEQAPWLLNFLRIFETRPGVVGAFATVMCLALVVGVVFTELSDRSTKKLMSITDPSAEAGGNSVASISAPIVTAAATPSADAGGIVASTNPVTSLQPVATLFGQPAGNNLFQPQAQAVSFAPAR
jgi:hypothetical protein